MKRFLILLSVAVLFLNANVHAQILPAFGGSRTGTTGFQFLKIAPDARAASMGGAITATVNDVSGLFWNPAGITKVDSQSYHLQVSQVNYFTGINMQFVGLVHRFSPGTYVGLSYVGLNTGNMTVTTEFQPFGNGQTFSAFDQAIGLTLGRILTDNFSFGITAKYVRETFADIHADAGVVDFGFQYNIGKANTRFAAGVSNFGFNSEPKGDILTTTLNGTDTISSFEKIGVPAVFRLGLAWDPVKKKNNIVTIAAQLNHPTDNNETFNLGAEYGWRNLLYCRTGYEFGQDERGLPSFGFGIHFKRNFGMIQLDYGFSDKSRLGSIHRLTLGLSVF